jgi:tRNA nucleotidyltransferase/poly(A) polymerase
MPDGRKRKWFFHPWFLNLMQVFKADAQGTTPTDLSLYDTIYRLYHATIKKMPKPPKPLLTGEEIMEELHLKPGRDIGKILEEMEEKQLGGELKTKKQALTWIKALAKKRSKN